MSNTKTIKYRVNCEIHKLKINKNIDFETKIVWKRHQNKAETKPVKHAHGYSIFDETLTLQFNMVYNFVTNLFEQKNTEIVAVIVYQGKIKSGGYVKYNIADNLNSNPNQITKVQIPLTQCPDPTAFVEISFSYEKLSDEMDGDEPSILNASSRDLNMSRIDFHDDKLSFEMDKIVDTIRKFQDLALVVKKKGKDQNMKVPNLITQLQTSQGQKEILKKTISKLEATLQKNQLQLKQEKKKARKQIEDLQKRIKTKNQELKSAKEIEGQQKNGSYKDLYQNAMKELDELRNSGMDNGTLRKSLDLKFAAQMDDVGEIAKFERQEETESQKFEELSRQNVQLQSQVASMSHKLAQLFNASYQFGGAKLLDFLQTSIGLTEFNG